MLRGIRTQSDQVQSLASGLDSGPVRQMKSIRQKGSVLLGRKRDGELVVFQEGTATCWRTVGDDTLLGLFAASPGNNIEAGLRICGVDIVRSQEPMSPAIRRNQAATRCPRANSPRIEKLY